MGINVVYRYSHLGENLLHFTYDALGFNKTGTLEICGGCKISKAKARAERNKTYTRATNL